MHRGLFFFFQAEDGIRDHCVTGVQTCALPISICGSAGGSKLEVTNCDLKRDAQPALTITFVLATIVLNTRSEERRVGKEWRSRWSPYHLKKKRRIKKMKDIKKKTKKRVTYW